MELDAEEASVGAVLASEVDSSELRVDAMLCFDGVRRTAEEGVDWGTEGGGLRTKDLVGFEADPAHKRPKNLEATACNWGIEMPDDPV